MEKSFSQTFSKCIQPKNSSRLSDLIRSINSKSTIEPQLFTNVQKRVTLAPTIRGCGLRKNLRFSQSPAKTLSNESTCSQIHSPNKSTVNPSLSLFTFGEYLQLKELAKSRQATVFLVRRDTDSREFAMKVYDIANDHSHRKMPRILAEVQALDTLVHPNIIKIVDTVETPSQYSIVMEYFPGKTLRALARNKKISEDLCKVVFKQLVKAVAYCHSQHVCHRDIKIENVLVSDSNKVKLVDFGFACREERQKFKGRCGTPCYMAPEIVKKKEYNGAPADVWALGVLLYSLVTGAFPFKGKTDTELYAKISLGKYLIPKKVSPEVTRLLARMLTLNPSDRITARDILNDKWLTQCDTNVQ